MRNRTTVAWYKVFHTLLLVITSLRTPSPHFVFLIGLLLLPGHSTYANDMRETLEASVLFGLQSEGQISVILNLNVSVPDSVHQLGELEHDQAIMAIVEEAQNSLLARLDAVSAAYASVQKFPYTPQMSMTIPEATYRILKSDAAVAVIVKNGQMIGDLGRSVSIIYPSNETQELTGSGFTVAVLDTGIDPDHSAFAGKVVAEACFSGAGNPAASYCPNGDSQQVGAGAGIHCEDLNFFVSTNCDHGTHVAGIAVGGDMTGPDSELIQGVARQADLIPVQVFSKTFLNNGSVDNVALYSDIAMGLSHIYNLRRDPSADVGEIVSVNLSLGGGTGYNSAAECHSSAASLSLRPIIQMLRNANVATVVASGNESNLSGISAPACIEEAIAVGGTDFGDAHYVFGNSGNLLDLFAPGVGIYSAQADGSRNQTSATSSKSGTSMATPHVAGAWAIMRQSKPNASVDEIEQAFKTTGQTVTVAGVSRQRINIDAALALLNTSDDLPSDPPPPIDPPVDSPTSIVNACLLGQFPSTDIIIGNAICLPGISNGGQLQMHVYVPADRVGSNLLISTGHGNGNASLLHKASGRPSRTDFDQISNGVTSDERILVSNVQSGWHYVHVQGEPEFSNVTLLVDYTDGTLPPDDPVPTDTIADACRQGQSISTRIVAGNTICLPSVSTGNQVQMEIFVPADKIGSRLEIIMSHGSGNADLLHKFGNRPSVSEFDQISANSGNEERIVVDNLQQSWHYIHVGAADVFSGVSLLTRFVQ